MVQRRDLVGGGLLAGLGALVAPATAAPAGAAAQDCYLGGVEAAIGRLGTLLDRQLEAPWRRVDQVRAQQREWIRAHHSYPQFIEIGLDVWDDLHDWHVRHQQPLSVARRADGRYAMSFHFSTLILRPELDPAYIGPPYDNQRQP